MKPNSSLLSPCISLVFMEYSFLSAHYLNMATMAEVKNDTTIQNQHQYLKFCGTTFINTILLQAASKIFGC